MKKAERPIKTKKGYKVPPKIILVLTEPAIFIFDMKVFFLVIANNTYRLLPW